MYNRIHLIVLDSVGIGAAPDAEDFGDLGCDTLGHICEIAPLNIPNLEKMGIGRIRPLENIKSDVNTIGYVSKLEQKSVGKDTMTGHWELMGLITEKSFPVYPHGFPHDLLDKIETFSNRKIICNLPYSGTKVIDDYAQEQIETGALILYTSADPVLQIAAHEDIIPLEELYGICKYIRSITLESPLLGRIIARPYLGVKGNYYRTSNRHDYAVSPYKKTMLDLLKNNGKDVIAIGKIADIFNQQGVTQSVPTKSNEDGIDQLIKVMSQPFTGLSFLNLVDFDAMYGHRRNPIGYAKALEAFDRRLLEIISGLKESDLLLITADHGNDPTFLGTDHTREYVPLIAYSPCMKNTGTLSQGYFSDVAATIAEVFGINGIGVGNSFLSKLL